MKEETEEQESKKRRGVSMRVKREGKEREGEEGKEGEREEGNEKGDGRTGE